jgi:hypothetical protein
VFKVDIADTTTKKALGLMHREKIRKNEGMFFIMGNEAKYDITMANMKFPIDIIWINKEGKIVEIFNDAKPSKSLFLGEMYRPKKPAKYILEVLSGVAKEARFKIGDKLYLKDVIGG